MEDLKTTLENVSAGIIGITLGIITALLDLIQRGARAAARLHYRVNAKGIDEVGAFSIAFVTIFLMNLVLAASAETISERSHTKLVIKVLRALRHPEERGFINVIIGTILTLLVLVVIIKVQFRMLGVTDLKRRNRFTELSLLLICTAIVAWILISGVVLLLILWIEPNFWVEVALAIACALALPNALAHSYVWPLYRAARAKSRTRFKQWPWRSRVSLRLRGIAGSSLLLAALFGSSLVWTSVVPDALDGKFTEKTFCDVSNEKNGVIKGDIVFHNGTDKDYVVDVSDPRVALIGDDDLVRVTIALPKDIGQRHLNVRPNETEVVHFQGENLGSGITATDCDAAAHYEPFEG